ncbi:MAG: di-heme oxidoredictase family protein, partial [Myxococcota bacterium]
PYTDLLLHDMGPDLADGRAEYLATGLEWRTPPLWGVGLMRALTSTPGFLHDGRARTIEEAILWHGGEAQRSRDAFAALDADSRRALVSFVRSL